MRFLKKILIGVLVYEAVFLPFVVIMQTVNGGDFTAAYAVGGIGASVELILCSLIKREDGKNNSKSETRNEELRDKGGTAKATHTPRAE